MNYKLRISGIHNDLIYKHLFPGDDKEAVAIAVCGRLELENEVVFMIHKVFPIPYSDCYVREKRLLKWSTRSLEPILALATKKNLTVLKIHSHPNGNEEFSEIDDESDKLLFDSIFGWTLNASFHLSCIMLPDGKIKSRIIDENLLFRQVESVAIIGDEYKVWRTVKSNLEAIANEANLRNIQTFGEGTLNLLKEITIAVIGCSGTGSIVLEQLARLGVGKLILVDPDKVEQKNLNRIINTTLDDANKKRYKVDVLSKAIASFGFETKVKTYNINLYNDIDVIKQVAAADIIFGCVDSADGRHLINLISNFYLLPLFDVGVRLDADGEGGIESINGTVHYVQPGKFTLMSRGVFDSEQLKAAGHKRKNPEYYAGLFKEKYIKNVDVDSPAVISINMFYASMAVNDFLARIHPFRLQKNSDCAIQRFVFTEPRYLKESADNEDKLAMSVLGRGDVEPLLSLPEFTRYVEKKKQ